MSITITANKLPTDTTIEYKQATAFSISIVPPSTDDIYRVLLVMTLFMKGADDKKYGFRVEEEFHIHNDFVNMEEVYQYLYADIFLPTAKAFDMALHSTGNECVKNISFDVPPYSFFRESAAKSLLIHDSN